MYIKRRERWRSGLTLTGGAFRRLCQARRQARRDGDVDLERRLRAVLLAGHDHLTQESVGFIVERSANCITRWVMAYEAGGLDALRPGKAPGAAPKLDSGKMEELRTVIIKGPEWAGLDTGVWTGPIVQALIEKQFGVELSVSQVRRILHKAGQSVKYPRRLSPAANPDEQGDWLFGIYPEIKKKLTGKAA